MKTTLALLAAGLLLAGCASDPAGFLPQESAKYSIENTEKFALLDAGAQALVTCTGLQENWADGRLEVVANVRNRQRRPAEVQLRCVFTDAAGQPTGDDTPWQTLGLEPESTQAVRYFAVNRASRKFTISVRSVP